MRGFTGYVLLVLAVTFGLLALWPLVAGINAALWRNAGHPAVAAYAAEAAGS